MGMNIFTVVPSADDDIIVSVPPHIIWRRSLILASATCGLSLSPSRKPGPVSVTVISLPFSVWRVLTVMCSGLSSGSSPCLMAFSTIGWSVSGGTLKRVCGVSNSTNKLSSKRVCSTARYARVCSSSSVKGTASSFANAVKFFRR